MISKECKYAKKFASIQNKFSNNHRRNNRRRNYFSNIKSMDNKIKYMKNFENYGAPIYHSISIDLIPLKSVNTKKISVPIFSYTGFVEDKFIFFVTFSTSSFLALKVS